MAESYSVEAFLKATGTAEFAKAFERATKNVDGLERSTGKAGLTIGKLVAAVGITAAVAKGFQMVKSSIDGAISRYDTLNAFPKVMQQIGFSADDSKGAIDKLSEGIQGLPTTLDTVASTAQRIAVLTGNLDGATETTLALNNAFIASGSSQADASRGLEQYVQMLSKGGVDLQSWRTLQETMGVALNDTAKAFGFAGASAQNDLYDALKNGDITFDQFNKKIIELSNETGGFADRALTASGGIRTSWSNMGTSIVRGVTNIIGAIDDMLKNTPFGSIENILKNIGKWFFDMLNGIAQSIPPTVEKIKEIKANLDPWMPLIQGIIATIGGFIAAVAVFNTVRNSVLLAVGVFNTIKTSIMAVKTSMTVLNAVMAANVIGLVVVALIALGVAFVVAYNKVEWFRNMVDAAWAWIKNAFFTALDWIKNNVVIPIMGEVSSFINEILGRIRDLWDKYGNLIMNNAKLVFDNIKNIISAVMGVIKGIFQIVWPIISGIVQIAWGVIKTVIRTTMDLISGIIDTVMALIRGDWEGAWNSIKDTADKIWKNIVQFFKDVDLVQIGKDIIQGLIDGIGSMGSAVWEAAKGIAGNIKESITNFLKISSPSQWMRDNVGKQIGAGIAIGMDKSKSALVKAAKATTDIVKGIGIEPMNLDIAGQVSRINSQASRQIESQLSSEINVSKQPAKIVLQLGNNDFEAFVDDINSVNAVNATLRRF